MNRDRRRRVRKVEAGEPLSESRARASAHFNIRCTRMPSRRTRMPIRIPIRNQWRPLRNPSLLHRPIPNLHRLWIPQPETRIIKILRQQHNIRQRIINRQNQHRGQNILQYSAKNIEDISEKPDDDEFHTQTLGRTSPEIFDDLGREDDDPAGDGNGAADSGDGFNVDAVAAGWRKHCREVWRTRLASCGRSLILWLLSAK